MYWKMDFPWTFSNRLPPSRMAVLKFSLYHNECQKSQVPIGWKKKSDMQMM